MIEVHDDRSSRRVRRAWLCFGRALVLLVIFLPLPSKGAEPRGIWWWTSSGQPCGVDEVLGNNDKEIETLQFFKAWNFRRIYCSFSTATCANPAVIRAWNEKLHAAGIQSQFLLSENTWIFPSGRTNLLTAHIQPKLLDFNAAATNAAQRYEALHLDIEPHGLPQWTTNTPAGRRDYLLLLRDTFQAVRDYLDAHGGADIPVYADLPVWYDQLVTPIGWNSVTERDAWFQSLAQSLAGISLMAYERPTMSGIEDGVSWELQNFPGEVRVALEADIGTNGHTWSSFATLMSMIQAEEHIKSPSRELDVHHFVPFHDFVPPIETWRNAWFGTNASRGEISGDAADPDADRIPNLLEYAFALDPLTPSNAGLPAGNLTATQGACFVSITFQRPVAATDLTYRLLVSTNLTAWVTNCSLSGTNITRFNDSSVVRRFTTNAVENIVIDDGLPLSTATERFMKIEITHP